MTDEPDEKKLAIIEELNYQGEQHGFKIEAFLRAHGWKYTSEFPDCCWRWCKVVDGERITEDTRGALRLEEYLP